MVPNGQIGKGQNEALSTNYNNIIDQVFEYSQVASSQQLETTKGTVFGAYNAVTGYFQNVRNFKDEEIKFNYIMAGTALSRTQTAFDLCTEFTKSGASALN